MRLALVRHGCPLHVSCVAGGDHSIPLRGSDGFRSRRSTVCSDSPARTWRWSLRHPSPAPPLWVKPANPDILPGLQTCKVIRNTHVSSEFESSLLLCQSGTGGGAAANIKCYRQCIFDPGADAILTQPSSLKAKFYNSFGARNWVNEIPACGWKMHRQQHEAAGARSMGLCLERHLVIYLQDKTAALSWSPPTGCEADKGRAVLVGDPL